MDNNKEAKKQKLAYLWAILTLVITAIIGAGVVSFSNQVLPPVSYTHLDVYKRQEEHRQDAVYS